MSTHLKQIALARLMRSTFAAACAATSAIAPASGHQTETAPEQAPTGEDQTTSPSDPQAPKEIIVTARRREESLQRVPDSITVLTAETIEEAGVTEFRDFVNLTPNLSLQQGFRAGASYLTLRGVSTGQNGWAPVTFVVDGVPTATLEGFNQGTLFDIERIEVLRGPQSALYGAGAIAGAINVLTREPTDIFEASAQLLVADGNDFTGNASISGPLAGPFNFRLSGSFRQKDGVFRTIEGEPLDREDHEAFRARLIGEFNAITLDLRGFWARSKPGAIMQQVLPTTDPLQLQQILNDDDYETRPSRGILGVENRLIREAAAKVTWQLAWAELGAIVGYSDIDQHSTGSSSWLRPPSPVSFCGPIGGPGQPADCFQDNTDNVTTTTADLRLTSPSDQRFRWLVGVAYIDRQTLNSFFLDQGVVNASGDVVQSGPPIVFGATHLRNDEFYGVYGQINYDLTPRTELTLAGRWDRNRYDNTQFADATLSEIVPAADGTITQRFTDSEFQPKAQLSQRWTDDVMSYVSVSRGFRTGFFNSGAHTAPETSMNYELGLKSRIFDRRLILNAAVFHIDYSDQQLTFITPDPPFRASTNIPSTSINGLEIEASARPTRELSFSAGLGVTDAQVDNGTDAPVTPDYTLNLAASYDREINAHLSWLTRIDYRRQGSYYLHSGNRFEVGPRDYINARSSIQGDGWSIGVWVENLLNERQTNELVAFPFYSIRLLSLPRTYGLELRFRM